MAEPHLRPAFQNAVTYTVAITVTVAGGARHGTADRRARKVAERLADSAARMPAVVEVSATAGPTANGDVLSPQRVRFAAANSGQGTYAEPDKLDRYLDPDHELALRSLAAANAAWEARERADRERRLALGCHNAHRRSWQERRPCACVYCQPDDHHEAIQLADGSGATATYFAVSRCLCGTPVPEPGRRCSLHRDRTIVLLDGDSSALQLLARHDRQERQ